ncbi:hypothetical protein [Magnetovibrio sp.]|uniref:hypothetical protein n=1 Tax=Magnetovibrio sp. TaxID=2024836 RepID=UPI002F95EFFD
MIRPFFKRLIKACALVVVLSIAVDGVAKADSPYPRTQVENHLRAMFPDLGLGAMSAVFSGAGPMDFDVFAKNERIRFTFYDLKKHEWDATGAILFELFDEVMKFPAVGIDPTKDEADLYIMVSDNLPFDALYPAYKKLLKSGSESEQDYIQDLRKGETGGAVFQAKRYMRNTGEPLVVVATERDVLHAPERFTFDAQIRFALFHALTGARASHVIQPSVMNPRSVQERHNGFAPIDRAVLRAIFNNKDWSGLAYKPKMKLLTDRVMEQLERNP